MSLDSRDTPLLAAARALWTQHHWEEALAQFEAAVAAAPENARVLVDCARAHGARYGFARAEELLARLLALAGDRAEWQAHAGESYRLIQRLQEATRCFERAVELARHSPDHCLTLASLYERRHRLEPAAELIGSVLRARPDWPPALLVQAKLARRRNEPQQAEDILRRLAGKPTAPHDLRAEAFAELAQVLDQRGDYDGAMEAAVLGKQLMLPRDAAERQTAEFVLGRFRALHEHLTDGQLRGWRAASDVPELAHPPLALLTGFPRSGTTLLEQALDAHPDIVSSEERDIMGFEVFPALVGSVPDRASVADLLKRVSSTRLAEESTRYFRYHEAWLGGPLAGRLLLDKNPGATLLLPVYLRVFPQLRTLVALRDPRDVILSCFFLYLPLNPLSVNFLTLERVARKYALDFGAWLRMRECLPAPWLEVRYEDVVGDLPAQARRALEFLGLPWHDAVAAPAAHARAKAVLSPTYEAVAQPVHNRAIGRWRNYQDYIEPVLPILEPVLKAFGYGG
jgi:tetratricopeptide (TPR) repeat protein